MSYGGLHPTLAVEGDSNTSPDAFFSWIPIALSRASASNTYDLVAGYNKAVGGETAAQMSTNVETSAVNAVNSDVVVMWAGTNDLLSTKSSAAVIYNSLTTAWKSYIDNGADYVVAVEVTPRADANWNPNREVDRQSLNKMIDSYASDKSLAGYADHIRVVKVPASFDIGTDTVEGVHLSAQGAQKIGTEIGVVLASLGAHDNRPYDLGLTHGFDAVYYLSNNPDVAAAAAVQGGDAFNFAHQHYETFGWHEGRNPNELFDTKGYLSTYTDVAAANIDPLTHFDIFGWKEERDPSAHFDTKGYESHYPDVVAAHFDPMLHYLQFGKTQGFMPFDDGHFG